MMILMIIMVIGSHWPHSLCVALTWTPDYHIPWMMMFILMIIVIGRIPYALHLLGSQILVFPDDDAYIYDYYCYWPHSLCVILTWEPDSYYVWLSQFSLAWLVL